MLKAVLGFYENGVITLEENPDIDHKVPVIVTFLNGYEIKKITETGSSSVIDKSLENKEDRK